MSQEQLKENIKLFFSDLEKEYQNDKNLNEKNYWVL
jgi:hypothetical protein